MKISISTSFKLFQVLGHLAAFTMAISDSGASDLPAGLAARDEDCADCGQVCEGLTCSTICNGLGCGQTCRCTSICSLFCPNGDCNACCSCVETLLVGLGDVVRISFDNTAYVVNRTHIPEDTSNSDVLHKVLAPVNQTWWQHDGKKGFVELPHAVEARDEDCADCGSGGFSCQLQCTPGGIALGCFSSCGCSQTSIGCNIHCSSTACLPLCACNKT